MRKKSPFLMKERTEKRSGKEGGTSESRGVGKLPGATGSLHRKDGNMSSQTIDQSRRGGRT